MIVKHGMNYLTVLNSARNHKLAPPLAVLRRQQFLIRVLGVRGENRMQGSKFEADSDNILRAITPVFDPNRHKGQAGKIAVIGGCREYTGAPYFAAYFAAISALKIGADLSHVFCTKDAAPVIKSYSPELIVHPVLEESYSVGDRDKDHISRRVVAEVDKWMERFDCLVVGPGLGRDPFLLDCVSEIIKQARQSNVPIIIDGDGLFLVTNNLGLVSGYPLAILTPNVNEYKRLVQKVLNCEVNDQDAHGQLLSLAKQIGEVTILRKGKCDLISDGEIVKSVSNHGSPRRCGGQGDILSGSVAVFLSWARQLILADEGNLIISPTNPTMLGCIAGSALLRKAASLAFEDRKRSTLTTDIIECLGRSLEDICPAC
uniref:ATP-dependent (S)-NAD(P)H-hydrate dehydratase n=1 Tax=Populus trichocarpa TaxID=3694 RepID=A0A2K1ZKL7_POPTR|eukprot:XP_002312747.3 ATP-dependent (S)-NAD(P)H-hydrate dehydratase isoform X2 [Populus trichocarpa]